MAFSAQCYFVSAGATGAIFTLLGSFLLGFWPNLFDAIVKTQLVLTPTSYSNGLWEVTPIPIYLDFYMWNWTNPEDILDPDPEKRKPKLVEMGPYVYSEKRKKLVLNWNDDNNTVTFLQKKTWFFEPALSKGTEDDEVTTINVPALAAAYAVRNHPPIIKNILNGAMVGVDTKISVTKKVRELLFDGYPDILLDFAAILPPGFLPVIIPFDKFGWFYTRNESATYDGVFNMYTGKSDIRKFGTLGQWNYENPTSKYQAHCGKLSGSAGEFFLPRPSRDGDVTLFAPDLCRTLTLPYKEDVVVDGIRGYRYWGDEHIFDNLTKNPDAWCYCPGGECPPHGAIDVSTCKWGTPAYVSFPHFFHADPYYRDAVKGMLPNEQLHQTYVDLERTSGIPLQVEASLQINMLLEPRKEYELFQDVPKMYFPTFWFKQRARIDDELGPTVRLISRIPEAGYILFGAFVCMGLSILCIIGVYSLKFRRKGKSGSDLKLVGIDK